MKKEKRNRRKKTLKNAPWKFNEAKIMAEEDKKKIKKGRKKERKKNEKGENKVKKTQRKNKI